VGDADAYVLAVRLLRHRDYAARDLARRLLGRGLDADRVEAALVRLRESGFLDDRRYAFERARVLAERGAGDALIRHDLERAGVSAEDADDALGTLPPERERAEAIVGRRGGGARTARHLQAKGFDRELIQALVASDDGASLG
jgi:regulatory protein